MRKSHAALAAILVLGTGCADDMVAGGVDAGPTEVDGGSGCAPPPSAAMPWLEAWQDDIVARLAGAREISPGVTLSDRASAGRRAATRDFLVTSLSTAGLDANLDSYGAGTNVWAELPPAESAAPWIVLGAHFDSVPGSPGANDNATGVALVLAAARHLATVECREVGVVFAFFDEEEIGLVGSENFAAMLIADGRPIEAVHTVDQMGWDQDDDRAIELERPSADLFAFYQAAVTSSGMAVPLIETSTGSTDHVSFRARGFAAIGLTEGFVSGDTTPHYHAPTDTYPTVDFAYLASTTRLVAHALGGRARPQ